MNRTNKERMRLMRWCLLGLLLVSTVGCSDEGQQSRDEQAEIEQAKTEFQKLCDKYARVYVAEEMPNFRGYLDRRTRSIRSAIGWDILNGRRDYQDVYLEKNEHYIGTPVKDKKRAYKFRGSGYFRVFLEDLGKDACVAPMQDILTNWGEKSDPSRSWARSKGKCLAAKKIDLNEVEYIYEHFQEAVKEDNSTWIHGSRFVKGEDGTILVEVMDVRRKYVTAFGNVEVMSCIGRATEALGIAYRERRKRHGS